MVKWRLGRRSVAQASPHWAWVALRRNEGHFVWWGALLHVLCCAANGEIKCLVMPRHNFWMGKCLTHDYTFHCHRLFFFNHGHSQFTSLTQVLIRNVEIWLTLIKGVCLICLPLACLPCLAVRHMWSTEMGVPVLSPPPTVPMAFSRFSALLSAILGYTRGREVKAFIMNDRIFWSKLVCVMLKPCISKESIFFLNISVSL